MSIQVLVSQAGPLPIKVTFESPGDMPVYLEVNGSVWGQTSNTLIGIAVQVDRASVGAAQVFSNGNTTHRTVVPGYFQLELGQGTHALYLTPLNAQTVSDINDFYTAVLHY